MLTIVVPTESRKLFILYWSHKS